MFYYLLGLIVQLYTAALLIRALLQLVQADFYNPLSQTVFKVCAPVVNPLQRIIPSVGRLNLAALVAAITIRWLFYVIVGQTPLLSLVQASLGMLFMLADIYFWGIFILIISSWVGTGTHPMVQVVAQVIEPYLRPFRKIIPPIGMIDISPMVAILVLIMIRDKLLPMLVSALQPLLLG